jgi:hypothetical protein
MHAQETRQAFLAPLSLHLSTLYSLVSLLDQLKALNAKHTALKADLEKEKATSPEQLRENLLVQVKADNQEIAAMERK